VLTDLGMISSFRFYLLARCVKRSDKRRNIRRIS